MRVMDAGHGAVRGRPLYVLGSRTSSVDLDGPALVVRARGRAAARYPLVRVSRVVSAGNANWKSTALYACLEQGIPVVFTARNGAPAGYLQPSVRVSSSLHSVLEEWLTRPDWREHYAAWLRAERMRMVREWRTGKASRGEPIDAAELRELVRRYVYNGGSGDSPQGDCSIYSAVVTALACEQLRHAGARHRYAGFGGSELDLAGELHQLLVCVLELDLQGLGASLDVNSDVLLRVFQTYARKLTERSRGILGRLHRRASEVVQG